MKRVYWLAPCLATTLFAAYYHEWAKKQDCYSCPKAPRVEAPDKPLALSLFDYDHRDGRAEAEADWAKGTPKYLTYGLPVHWIREFGEILRRDYGVDQHAVAGCVVDDSLLKYVAAYNEVTERHLKEIHGSKVMDEVVKKAEALYAERHPASPETQP